MLLWLPRSRVLAAVRVSGVGVGTAVYGRSGGGEILAAAAFGQETQNGDHDEHDQNKTG